MLGDSILKNTSLHSPLKQSSYLHPEGGFSAEKSVDAPLMLTSLVDAFSILVIYLLMHFSASGEILIMNKNMELPKAFSSAELVRHTIVKFEEGKYYIKDKEVTEDGLVAGLLKLREDWQKYRPDQEFPDKLIVQADRRTAFKQLNSVVLAGSQTGYSEIKFAVVSMVK